MSDKHPEIILKDFLGFPGDNMVYNMVINQLVIDLWRINSPPLQSFYTVFFTHFFVLYIAYIQYSTICCYVFSCYILKYVNGDLTILRCAPS